jgi:hypothetical protein
MAIRALNSARLVMPSAWNFCSQWTARIIWQTIWAGQRSERVLARVRGSTGVGRKYVLFWPGPSIGGRWPGGAAKRARVEGEGDIGAVVPEYFGDFVQSVSD